jgi:hypothetical protein
MEIAGAVRVLNAAAQFLFWCDKCLAERFIGEGNALPRGTKRRIRAVVWIGEPMKPSPEWFYPKPEPVKYHRSCKNPWNCC